MLVSGVKFSINSVYFKSLQTKINDLSNTFSGAFIINTGTLKTRQSYTSLYHFRK